MGCGALGGFVPRLDAGGYDAIGIDPAAPEGNGYRRVEFEHCDVPSDLDAVIACTSLHHVADPSEVLNSIANALRAGGLIVVIEWDWEGFDEATARWSMERLASSEPRGFLYRRREEWLRSGQTWDEYFRAWVEGHHLHSARRVVEELDQRFERVLCDRGPYCFPDLFETDERDAINAGQINATRIDYVGRLGRAPRRTAAGR